MKLNIPPTEGMEPASKLMPQNILRTAPPQVKSNSEEVQIFGEETTEKQAPICCVLYQLKLNLHLQPSGPPKRPAFKLRRSIQVKLLASLGSVKHSPPVQNSNGIEFQPRPTLSVLNELAAGTKPLFE